MSFFSSGAVDTNVINRDKLPVGVYVIALTDMADYYGATNGDRTQINFTVEQGCVAPGTKGSHIVMHKADKQWQMDKARGEIASMLGAFLGFTRDQSGLKITQEVFDANTRVVRQSGGKTVSVTRGSEELPLVGKTAFLVVAPYFDKKTGARKINPKTNKPSVTYEIVPLSAKLSVTTAEAPESGEFGVDAPDAPSDSPTETPAVDGLALALADGWRSNPNAPAFFFKKGELAQLKEPALRARYGQVA